jgi:hypothetical protein
MTEKEAKVCNASKMLSAVFKFLKLAPSFEELYWNFTGTLQENLLGDGSRTRITFLFHYKNWF